MSQAVLERSRLLAGCAGAALALGLVLGASPAAAQGVQATSDVVTGTAFVSAGGPNQTNVEVVTPTVVIDWTPTEDAGGNALDFLPAGSLLNFNSGQLPDFAVLNRILPATNGNIARIDGSVISRVTSAAGPVPGGFVAFYSPTGLLIGGTASFDVGRLLLTTRDISSASFETFAQQGGFMTLTGAAGSTARVQINPGAQILATPENAFFAVVAADIEMRGTARVNGSHAFVAGEVVNLRFSNGLFDIAVPVGTAAAGEVVTLDGTVGGPSSTGVTGDNHMIYAVARASQDPISMLFRGNLGFDPAQSVGVVNGEIILAANYNVFGRTVDGGSIAGGVNAVFGANSELTNVRADIVLEDFAASSSLLAIGTHRTQAAAVNAASAVAGNLLLVGREAASLTASNNRNLTVTGDVLVSAQDYGVSNSGLQSLDVINAQGGTARLEALGGGSINITGQARVLADAFAGVETIDRIAGTAQGGQASLGASGGGTVAIGSDVLVRANGFGTGFQGILVGAAARGGSADLFARSGGAVTLDSSVIVAAQGFGANGSLFSPSTRSDAYGGQARITVSDGGGSIFVQGFAEANAGATALDANVTGDGALADAGEAVASITGPGSINVRGDLRLIANALAGNNAGGTGGTGLGGRATAITFSGGTIDVGLLFRADALGIGGNGINGGAGFGGIAGANAIIGSIAIEGNAEAQSDGFGGGAAFGFGGAGGLGQGGNAFFQANGTLTQTAQVTIGGTGIVVARGRGGFGGAGSISTGPQGGRGGDGIGGQFNVPNQADPAFNSGAFLLAGGDNGRLVITGTATADASGTGGTGGSGGIPGGAGRGGDGTGGLAQVGMALLGQNGSVGLGRATFANVFAAAVGTGGEGGFSSGPAGTAGDGFGGSSVFTVDAGDATAGLVDLIATGLGGAGSSGGLGRGGLAAVFGGLGGTLTADSLSVLAEGAGGLAFLGTGGAGLGGEAAIIGDGITLNVNESVLIEASGRGGSSDDGAAGAGTGGRAYVAANAPGSVAITGHAEIFANGFGGNSITAFAAGTGSGGLAYVDALGGGTITLGSMQGLAIGRGGEAQSHEGGDGIGGTVRLRASGAGSRLNILRNMPAGFVAESPAGEAFISVDGFGEVTRDGDGIGGEGRGGTVEILADTGGTIGLPVNIINDPDRAADSLLVFASGTGGGSLVEGGVGGNASGGLVSISVDGAGSGVVMGDANLLALATAGSGLDLGLNTAGGTAVGGRRIITAVNGAALTFGLLGGQTGARGGDGTGTGDGGIARSGTNRVTLDNATLAVTGVLSLFDDTVGGNGQRGGDAIGPGEGGAAELSANASTINLTPDAGGLTGINVESAATGGAGVTGGDAFSGAVRLTLLDTDLTQGIVRVTSRAIGGSTTSANGAGGNAFSRPVLVNIDRATLDLSEFQATAAAIGGAGGVEIGGLGGNGLAGTANVTLTDSALTIAPGGPSTGGGMAIRADGIGGAGFAAGNGTGAQAALTVTRSAIDTDLLLVTARGDAIGVTGQPGGNGTGGLAQIALNGASTIAASGISLISSATTSAGGSATAGRAVLRVGADPAASITADDLVMLADAFGANAGIGANVAGQFNIDLNGGNLNLGFLFASSLGDTTSGNLAPSRLVANDGNINVTDALSAVAFGDLLVSSSLGGIIGSSAVAGTTTAIQLDASGTVDIAGDGSTGGLGGQSIAITAGRSILIDGNLSATDGGITLLANTGGGQPASQPPLSTIAMTQGAAINGGTGTDCVEKLGLAMVLKY